MKMKIQNARIYAVNGKKKKGLDMYLDIAGQRHYVYTRKDCGLLYEWLKNGKSIRELSTLKPSRSNKKQKCHHYTKRILMVINEFVEYELAS